MVEAPEIVCAYGPERTSRPACEVLAEVPEVEHIIPPSCGAHLAQVLLERFRRIVWTTIFCIAPQVGPVPCTPYGSQRMECIPVESGHSPETLA